MPGSSPLMSLAPLANSQSAGLWPACGKRSSACIHRSGPGGDGCTLALISEGGLLRLLLLDDSQTAWRMRRWLTHELLPALHPQQVKSRAHLSGPAGEKTQTVQAVLRLAEEIIELTGVGYSDALLAAIEDIEASTGLSLAPLQQVLRDSHSADSAHRPAQPVGAPVDARLMQSNWPSGWATRSGISIAGWRPAACRCAMTLMTGSSLQSAATGVSPCRAAAAASTGSRSSGIQR